MKDKGISKIAVVSSTEGFGWQARSSSRTCPRRGHTIVANEVYDKQATDLTDVLTKVKGDQRAGGCQLVHRAAQSLWPRT